MKATETGSKATEAQSQSHEPKFTKVEDGRKQPIRGLWERGGRYYARLSIEDKAGQIGVKRVLLRDKDGNPLATVPQAKAELERLKVKRTENDLPVLNKTPLFSAYVKTYTDFVSSGAGMKGAKTIAKEGYTLNRWKAHLGGTRLDKLRAFQINSFISKRLNEGASPRTVNLDVTVLRNLLKHAMTEGYIKALPTAQIRPLKHSTPVRALFSGVDLEKLATAAMSENEDGTPCTKNWLQFCDFIRLLAYSGAREQEGLSLKWGDVDFTREQLCIGRDGNTKNRTGRFVDFNPKLKEHLLQMKKRRAPDTEWVFASPQRGEKDLRAKSFRESLKLVRKHAAKQEKDPAEQERLSHVGFHDLRHHFISYAVMSGINFMVIARWVGHKDGGILIGKVYGHLSNAHLKEQAQRMNFGTITEESK